MEFLNGLFLKGNLDIAADGNPEVKLTDTATEQQYAFRYDNFTGKCGIYDVTESRFVLTVDDVSGEVALVDGLFVTGNILTDGTINAGQTIHSNRNITAAGNITGANLSGTNTGDTSTFSDAAFTLQDDADPTKQAKFQLSSIGTGTTRTYTLPNSNSALAALTTSSQDFTGVGTSFGSSVQTTRYGFANGASLSGTTKTVQFGTGGLSGSTTTINIGSATASGNITLNQPLVATTASFSGAITSGTWSGTAILPAKGGTGLTTLTQDNLLVGAGTGNVTFIAPGTSGNVVKSNGTTFASGPIFDNITISNDGSGRIVYLAGANGVGQKAYDVSFAGGNVTASSKWGAQFTVYGATTTTHGAFAMTGNNISLDTAGVMSLGGSMTATALIPSASTVPTNGMYLPAANTLGLSTNSGIKVRIASNGDVGIGVSPSAKLDVYGDYALLRNGTYLGYIGTGTLLTGGAAGALAIRSDGGPILFGFEGTERLKIESSGLVTPTGDNTQNFGSAFKRWGTIYAGTGTINTSDVREKTDIVSVDQAEMAVARDVKKLIRKFRFNDAVREKGADARIHFGLTAQDVAQAFRTHGLDPNRYGLYAEDRDETGAVRYGLRYEELLVFLMTVA